MKRICYIVSSAITVKAFLLTHIKEAVNHYDVYLVVNAEYGDIADLIDERCTIIPLTIERRIAPFVDLLAFIALFRLFRKHTFDVVHSVTPKAGLLAMSAACIALISKRVHTFTGQVWVTKQGFGRWFYKLADKVIARCATHLLADSQSQMEFLVSEGVVADDKISVLHNGSISGVDSDRFAPDKRIRTDYRNRIGVSDQDTVFLFIGRLTKDKGVLDLAQAFRRVCEQKAGCLLVIVGPDEEGISEQIKQAAGNFRNNLQIVGYTENPEHYMRAADVFCLPSYREGFGSVIIEAAAIGIPSIGSRIYGVRDAIKDNRTGLLYEPGQVSELAEKMLYLATDHKVRNTMGSHARERALRDFKNTDLAKALMAYYER